MTLKEIKYIVEDVKKFYGPNYDLDCEEHMDEFDEKAYYPVRKAVAKNDKTVIDYLKGCTKEEQVNLYTAIKAGVIEGQHPEAIALYKKICKDQGFEIDNRVK